MLFWIFFPRSSFFLFLGTERARLGTFRGFGTERARLGPFRGFGTERARLATFMQSFSPNGESGKFSNLEKTANFLPKFDELEYLQ